MPLGRLLIFSGLLLIGVGVLVTLLPKIPWLGRLPGDILIRNEKFTFAFPLMTCLVLSLLITLLVNLFFRR
ncbi:MAG: DUF2905 domain-containing protein [Candidatus Omnitrophica bacterium]|nr:DUF2905 domain-containing protein [Candidatus Omnitrophota bacterium]